MKKYLCYFATMLLVLAVTDICLGGALLRYEGISARISGIDKVSQEPLAQKGAAEGQQGELDGLIASQSCKFVRAAFNRDKTIVDSMLWEDAEYIVAGDKSSYIRYSSGDYYVEGYMATDRRLSEVSQSWYVTEDDGTITSGVEVMIEGEKTSQMWYIHYRNSLGHWKIYMLENGV